MSSIRHIRPASSFLRIADFVELWRYRELFFFLLWREFKVRYRQTAIGVVWAVFQPLFTLIIFVLIFQKVPGLTVTATVPYAVFVYLGIMFWIFFANGVSSASNALISQSRLVTKIYCPRLLIPLSSVCIQCVDLFFSVLFLVPLFLYFNFIPHILGLVLFPVFLLQLLLITVGLGFFFSAVNVYYRDVRYVLPFFIQLLFFVTPVIFTTQALGEFARMIISFNPMTHVIEGFRGATLFGLMDGWSVVLYTGLSVGVFLFGAFIFKLVERSFSDVL